MFDEEDGTELTEIREYGDYLSVFLEYDTLAKRWVLVAENQGGFDATFIDLFDVVDWIDENREEIEKHRE